VDRRNHDSKKIAADTKKIYSLASRSVERFVSSRLAVG
jgi:hypothetical protein